MSENKRRRSTNFSITETECLVDEILKRSHVIENKRTDSVTWKQKEEAWSDLTKTFNALTAGNRTEKMLKIKYDGIKRRIKQKHNKAKADQFKTGGGSAAPVLYTAWEEKILQLILLSVEGLPARNDSDKVQNNATIVTMEENIDVTFIDLFNENELIETRPEFNDVRPTVIEVRPKANATNPNEARPNDNEVRTNDNEARPGDNRSIPEVNKLRPEDSRARPEAKTVKPGASAPTALQELHINTGSTSWDLWTPSTLRTPRNPKLKTPSAQKRFESGKDPSIALARKELIEMQKNIADKELEKIELQMECLRKNDERKQKEHELLIKNLILENEVLKIKAKKE